jgi:hypothetical protein
LIGLLDRKGNLVLAVEVATLEDVELIDDPRYVLQSCQESLILLLGP